MLSVLQLVAGPLLASTWYVSTIFLAHTSSREQSVHLDSIDAAEAEFESSTRARRLNGEPIDEQGFHQSVRKTRAALLSIATLSIVVDAFQIAFGLRAVDGLEWRTWLPWISGTLIWVNILVLARRRYSEKRYFTTLSHLGLLSFNLFFVDALFLLAPPDLSGAVIVAVPPLQIVSTMLAFLALYFAISAPSGPSRVYSPQPGTIPARPVLPTGSGGASIFTRLTFGHCTPIARLAYKKGVIVPDDLPVLDGQFRAEVLHVELNAIYRAALKAHKAKLAKRSAKKEKSSKAKKLSLLDEAWPLIVAIYKANRGLFITQCLLSIVAGASFYGPAFMINRIIYYLESLEQRDTPATPAERRQQGLIYCVGLFATELTTTVIFSQCYSIAATRLVVRLRAQITSMLFAKALRRKDVSASSYAGADEQEAGSGTGQADGSEDEEEADGVDFTSKAQVLTLATVDTGRIGELPMALLMLATSPAELLFGGYLAISLLGNGAILGFVCSFAVQPLILFVGKYLMAAESRLQEQRDRRATLLNEALGSIRMLKFQAWESAVSRKVLKVRAKELKEQRNIFGAGIAETLLFNLAPTIVTLVSYGWFTLFEGRTLTPSIGFTASAVLSELRWSLSNIPNGINEITQSLVSVRRIARFLAAEDDEIVALPDHENHRDVGFAHATVTWPSISADEADQQGEVAEEGEGEAAHPLTTFALRDVNIAFEPRALNLICGKLGSGKSLLLLALLGEANIIAGIVACPNTKPDAIPAELGVKSEVVGEWIREDQTAYMPQSSYLINATLQDNVTYGQPYVETRYKDTLLACGLLPDLALLPDGDQTEIGEAGVGLSGGQKARVSLARAVYSRTHTLLLDDPLSAVDAETASHIAKYLFQGESYLTDRRTVLLVSHQVQLVAPSVAKLVMLEAGRVRFAGRPEDFLASEHYSGLVETEHELEKEILESGQEAAAEDENASGTVTPSEQDTQPSTPAEAAESEAVKPAAVPAKLIEEEKRATGSVRWSIYKGYLQAAGGLSVCLPIVAIFVASQAFSLVIQSWLRRWTEDAVRETHRHTDLWWIERWTALWGVQMLLWLLCGVICFASLRASRILFEQMLGAVLRAPLRFHDTTPRGRMLNRFGEDVEAVDSQLTPQFDHALGVALELTTSCIGVAIGGGAPFLALLVFLGPIFFLIGSAYTSAVRDIRRLSATSSSPVLTSFSDVVQGAAVIRAFGGVNHAMSNILKRLDDSNLFTSLGPDLERWVSIVFSALAAIIVFLASVFIVMSGISAGQAAYSLAFLIIIPQHLIFLVDVYASLEKELVSVERVVEYTDLPAEAAEILDTRSPQGWPSGGSVDVQGLKVRYADELPLVLDDVSFSITAGTKLGVCGATGSGKSTLTQSMFRFVEAAGGSIKIDGIDIASIGLKDLRSNITIVPQDPVVLSGPLRSTLDPFDEYTDEEVLESLRRVQLLSSIDESAAASLAEAGLEPEDATSNFRDLSHVISEGGGNLSAGQRQLLCLARAILRRSRLILFDEATSSVDADTDTLIQSAIHEAFAASTIITVAHRLRAIIAYDMVLVLDKGRVVELERPSVLLERTESKFYRLCRASGRAEFKTLLKMAHEADEARAAASL